MGVLLSPAVDIKVKRGLLVGSERMHLRSCRSGRRGALEGSWPPRWGRDEGAWCPVYDSRKQQTSKVCECSSTTSTRVVADHDPRARDDLRASLSGTPQFGHTSFTSRSAGWRYDADWTLRRFLHASM